MFNSGIIFVLALISLSAGAVLIDPVKRPKEVSRGLCNVIGFFVIVLSIIALLFSGYCILKSYSYKRHMIYRGIILNKPDPRVMGQNYMQGQMPGMQGQQMPMQQNMMPGMQGQQMPMQQNMMPGMQGQQMPMQQHMMPGTQMQNQQQMPMQQHMMPGKQKYKK